jgi:hypothetical protein
VTGCGPAGQAGPARLAGGPGHTTAVARSRPYGWFRLLAAGSQPTLAGLSLPADCVPHVGPPYQIGAVGRFYGGTFTMGSGVNVNNIGGTFCAVATVVSPIEPGAQICANFVAPSNGMQFNPLTATINIIPGVTTYIGHITMSVGSISAYVCDNAAPGPITLQTHVTASAGAPLLGSDCSIGPLTVPVTGELQGPLDPGPATATLTNLPFTIPTLPVSSECPAGLADAADSILALPSGLGHITVSAAVSVYVPSP